MTDDDSQERWIAHYDQVDGWAHLVRADSTNGSHWQEHQLDEAVSDPDGNFLVYVDAESMDDLLISMRFTETGPVSYHEDFDVTVFGGPTLPPAHLMRTIWWTDQTPWRDGRPLLWLPVDPDRIPW